MPFNQKGQTLIEAVVVIGIVVLLATGLVSGTTASLKSAQTGRSRTLAVSLAQEGVELMRTLRDQQWSSFQAHSGYYCLSSDHLLDPSVSESCPLDIVTENGSFGRSVEFDWQDPLMVVTVRVSYIEGASTRTTSLVTYFTQWR